MCVCALSTILFDYLFLSFPNLSAWCQPAPRHHKIMAFVIQIVMLTVCLIPSLCSAFHLPSFPFKSLLISSSVRTRATNVASISSPCSLSFCTLYGSRARCLLNAEKDDEKKTIVTCSGWATGPPSVSCRLPCPSVCMNAEDRPVASDGIAYCTDCSLVRASCESGFDILGPIARGVKNSMGVESAVSPSPTFGGMIGPTLTMFPSIAPSEDPWSSNDPSPYAVMESQSPDYSMEPSAEPSGEPWMEAMITSELMESSEPTMPPPMLLGPCMYTETVEQRMSCCVLENKWCVAPGGRCSSSLHNSFELSSVDSETKLENRTYGVCSYGTQCIIDDFGPVPERSDMSGICQNIRSAPICSLGECSRHGAAHLCMLKSHLPSWFITTCGAWASRMDGGRRPNCDRVCTTECVGRNARPLANDGTRFCSVCSLVVSSCLSNFTVWGPVNIGPYAQ